MKITRQSIKPTYDHRETGDRFIVSTSLNDNEIGSKEVTDPFHRTTVKVSAWDCLKGFFRGGVIVQVSVWGDAAIVEDIMELNADYKGDYGSSRRAEWDGQIETSLEQLAHEED